MPENRTECPRLVLDPGPLDPEACALTMRTPRLFISREERGNGHRDAELF